MTHSCIALPESLALAAAWADRILQTRGASRSADWEIIHQPAWSTVLRAPTPTGAAFLKVCLPALGHEPALAELLARLRPDCFPDLYGVEPARGWMLMADGGTTLRRWIGEHPGDFEPWRRALPLYAGLQMEMIPHREALLAAGLFDRRLSRLPELYAELIADEPMLRVGETDGLSPEEHRRLVQLTPRVSELCAELAAHGLPETLHHDDFHDGNIFLRGAGFAFFDWGEACLAHPFFTLEVGLRGIAYRFGWQPDAPERNALRQTYLSAWNAYAAPEQIEQAYRLSRPLAALCRALTWRAALAALPPAQRAADADAVSGWLQEFLALLP